jgi:protein CpxP
MKKQVLIPAIALFALGSGIATFETSGGAFAQAANAPAAAPDQRPHHDFAAHLERHIDHVKSELKITPAQEPLFNSWAQAMRDNAAEMQKSFADLRATRDQHRTAVDRLQTDVQLTQLRAGQDQRLLDAFKPLYASLSADQQKTADQLMAPRHFGHHRA